MDWYLDTLLLFDLPNRSTVLPLQTGHQTDHEETLLKIFTTVLLATAIYAGPTTAHGGGGAETIPGTNYTDMPSYHPQPVDCLRWASCGGKHLRWHRTPARKDQHRNAFLRTDALLSAHRAVAVQKL